MRTIKFRAWHNIDKRFYSFDLETITHTYNVGYYHPITGEKDCELDDPNLYSEKQLYTGVLDKNGKEIYEGDIVLVPDIYKERILDDGSGPVEPFNHIAPVVFREGSFGVDISDRGEILGKRFCSFIELSNEGIAYAEELEVIGNIHEHPELLEK
jgi:uncharacterized phage protein (TIGR01671 family)